MAFNSYKSLDFKRYFPILQDGNRGEKRNEDTRGH